MLQPNQVGVDAGSCDDAGRRICCLPHLSCCSHRTVVAASTAGVAEDAVRIVENFAGSLSFALTPGRHFGEGDFEKEETETIFDFDDDFREGDDEPSFLSYGTYGDTDKPSYVDEIPSLAPSLVHRLMASERQSMIMAIMDLIVEQSWELLSFVSADTEGVPSLAAELLGVMFLSYLAALVTLSSTRKERTRTARRKEHKYRWNGVLHLRKHSNAKGGASNSTPLAIGRDAEFDHDSASDQESLPTLTKHTQRISIPEKIRVERSGKASSRVVVFGRILKGAAFMPWKLVRVLVRRILRFIFSRSAALLVLYGIGWLYLCRVSQLRAMTIHR